MEPKLFNILVTSDFTFQEWEKEFKCFKGEIRCKQRIDIIPNANEKDYLILNTNIPTFWKAMYDLDQILSVLSEWLRNNIARHVGIIKRSIENLDKTLWLFDLSESENFRNGTLLAETILDHVHSRYNMAQPSSPMMDYEITLIQAWMQDVMRVIKLDWEFDKLPDQIKQNYIETKEMLVKARSAQKIINEQMVEAQKAAEKEMNDKQEVLDKAKEPVETIEDLTEEPKKAVKKSTKKTKSKKNAKKNK